MQKAITLLAVVLLFPLLLSTEVRAAPAPAPQAQGITHGAYIRPTFNYGQEIGNYNALVGKKLGVVTYFIDWSSYNSATGRPFDPFLLNQIRNQLPSSDWPVIMLTWMPQNGRRGLGCDADYNGAVPLSKIESGGCDAYIRGFAQELKARPERFILRFAHEMNLSNSVWWPGHFGQDASAFVRMWRHVYDVFESQGVNNVEWLWGPAYQSFPGGPGNEWNEKNNYYPGDNYVDWIGPDGYNWYTSYSPPLPWWSITDLYDQALRDFACRYAKPQIIHEIGSVDGGAPTTLKANWITEAYQRMANYPFVRAVIWFNDFAFGDPNQADFRVTSSTGVSGSVSALPGGSGSWTNAYRNALASPNYTSSLPSLAAATPSTTNCGGGPLKTFLPLMRR